MTEWAVVMVMGDCAILVLVKMAAKCPVNHNKLEREQLAKRKVKVYCLESNVPTYECSFLHLIGFDDWRRLPCWRCGSKEHGVL